MRKNNNEASKRCRDKKKEKVKEIGEKCEWLSARNAELEKTIVDRDKTIADITIELKTLKLGYEAKIKGLEKQLADKEGIAVSHIAVPADNVDIAGNIEDAQFVDFCLPDPNDNPAEDDVPAFAASTEALGFGDVTGRHLGFEEL